MVKLRWTAYLVASGAMADNRSPDSRVMSLQIGTDAGFEPKLGLKLAFSYACDGLCVGEVRQHVALVMLCHIRF